MQGTNRQTMIRHNFQLKIYTLVEVKGRCFLPRESVGEIRGREEVHEGREDAKSGNVENGTFPDFDDETILVCVGGDTDLGVVGALQLNVDVCA